MSAVTPVNNDLALFEKVLEETRAGIRLTLRERKHLPGEIADVRQSLDEIRPEAEFWARNLRANAERFRNLAADVAELETGLTNNYSEERTARYLDYLEQATMCDEQADLLEEEIELATLQLEELQAEKGDLPRRLNHLEEKRDHLVEQLDVIAVD